MIRVAVITISDSSSAGTREDRSGPAVEARVLELGWSVVERRLLPDEVLQIGSTVSEFAHNGRVDVILTTGGSGLAPRDVTPEAMKNVANREIPGFGELMRIKGRKTTLFATLSRSSAYVVAETLVVTLPGSPKGAVESLNAIADLIPHVVDLLHGRTEHQKPPA